MFDVSVHGLGTVGLPLAATLARTLQVHGVESSAIRRAEVLDRSTPLEEPGLRQAVDHALARDRLRVEASVAPAPVHLICVPTPLGAGNQADLTALHAAVDALAPHLRPGDLVCVESTVPPGTVPELAGRVGRSGVHWAAAPERLLPGRALEELCAVDRVVGGLTPAATQQAVAFYREALGVVVHPTDAVSATVAKLAENAARDVQIALANELSLLAERAGAHPASVLALASTHPRVDLLQPGIGVGGHCLPVDPWFLASVAPDQAPLLTAARGVNQAAAHRALTRIRAHADRLSNPLIACLGAAYKPDTADLRNSPALQIARALHADGRRIVVCDPHATPDPALPWLDAHQAVHQADLAVFLVAHQEYRTLCVPSPTAILDLCGARP